LFTVYVTTVICHMSTKNDADVHTNAVYGLNVVGAWHV